MQKRSLPERFDPIPYIRKAFCGEGTVALSKLARLQPRLMDPQGEISYQVEFGKDQQAVKFIRGKISGICHLQCQRCMESVDFPLQLEFRLGLISTDEESERLPQQYDPRMLEEVISLAEMLEEEILLALPIVPMHEPNECQAKVDVLAPTEIQDCNAAKGAKQNPFAVLKKFKVE